MSEISEDGEVGYKHDCERHPCEASHRHHPPHVQFVILAADCLSAILPDVHLQEEMQQ